MSESITGYIDHIIFRNEDNGYTVMVLKGVSEEDELTCVGSFPVVTQGASVELEGNFTQHPVYGKQFQAVRLTEKMPEDALAMERYLGSGAIKGIGAALAGRIVRHFGDDTFQIVENEPERLSEVKGISEKKAREIAMQIAEKSDMRKAMMFLQKYGISLNLGAKIYQKYGDSVYSVLQENPYRLADDISGVGFKIADEIAYRIGIHTDSDYRIKSGMVYTLLQATGEGHVYLPKDELFQRAAELLGVDSSYMEKHLVDLAMDRKIVQKEQGDQILIYPAQYYYLELNTARMLRELDIFCPEDEKIVERRIVQIEKETGTVLDEMQKKAVKALFAFLILMIGCTMLSRAADSMTIPRVKVDKPKTKTIVDEVTAKGVVVKNREEKISVVEGLKINYVNISEGSNIKVGDTLVELDTEDLEKKVNEIKESIAQEQKTLTRATEDYNKAINAKKQAVQGALNEMNTAKQALDNYSKLSDEEKDPGIEESLYSDYQSKKSMYDAAVSESNDTVDLDRALQDTKDSLKIDEYNKELAKLQPLLEAGGKITSEKEGIITSVFAENGGVTTDTIASIADKNEGYKFIGEIDKENRTSIKQGQVVALNLGTYGIIENLTIASISKNQDNNETLNVTVVLPVGIGEIDDSGEIVVSSKSRKYGTCVPLAALRQGDGNSYYVLVVTEKETVLGKELIAKKVDVKIEKRDGEYAAVTEGALGRNDKIIIDSNKTIEDGDRVRLETE